MAHSTMLTPPNFNPRSREGSDFRGFLFVRSSADFNPRSREGSDLKYQSLRVPLPDFNPRSREGSDLVQAYSVGVCCRFQSTLPRGERHGQDLQWRDYYLFQSTLPRGERLRCSIMQIKNN